MNSKEAQRSFKVSYNKENKKVPKLITKYQDLE